MKKGKKNLVRTWMGLSCHIGILWSVSLGILLAVEAGCAQTYKYKYDPNMELIDTWEDSRHREPFSFPYVAVYKDGCKELRFVASHHGSDKNTFQLIENEFEHHSPECVVLEGIVTKEGFSPRVHIERMKDRHLAERSEGGYAMKWALEKGIPFIGGEPSNGQLLQRILEEGYTTRDLQGFEILRTIAGGPGIITDGPPSIQDILRSWKDNYHIQDESLVMTTEEEFHQWYEYRYGKKYIRKKIGREENSPFADALVKAHGKIRDANIVGTIATMLAKYDKVLVIYGAGHRMQLDRVLQDMLGKPEFITHRTSE